MTRPPANGADIPDAGLRSLDHYKNRLPAWRYRLRQSALPFVRWETPFLAWFQNKVRTPALDTYFAVTANLGTHTFFMIFLPILFWCGFTSLGRAMVHILASGVILSGFIKDFLCLPRPLSPPLQRISMSGSAVLEYGFPSTHTTNAVSVAVYAFLVLKSPESTIDTQFKFPLELLCGFYATSIIAGRLYCGMHGFFDVLIGGLLGFVVSWCQWFYGGILDDYLYSGTYSAPLTITLAIIALVRIHPEPADNCPCFDDSVAFAGVLIGIEFGNWHYARSGWAWDTPVPATVPFTLADIGWVTAAVRIGVGVLIVFAWREMMKPSLLNGLPPLFRLIEQMGLDSPRRFFMQASEYKKVPSDAIDVDNVIPPISEIPSILQNIRHPRKRSVSVGPQSAADAYEALAYREKRRKESLSSADFAKTSVPPTEGARAKKGASSLLRLQDLSSLSFSTSRPFRPNIGPLTPPLSKIGSFEHMSGTDSVLYTPVTPIDDPLDALGRALVQQKESKEDQQHEREIFSLIEKPRVRYDVEVVTKLIVYAGIALLAVEINPVIFELVGLGIPAGSSR